MKSILFHAYDDDGLAGRLDAALDLARAFDAHLTIVHHTPYEYVAGLDPYGAFAAMIPVWREETDERRKRIESDLANEDVSWEWVEEAGPAALALLRASSLSDLILVGAREPRPGGKAPSITAGELAVSASCPVLVLPDGANRISIDAPALVAWDGSAEASHALRAALPLLRRAKKVYLGTVAEGGQKDREYDLPPVSGADYLARHDIGCEMVELDAGEEGVGRSLTDAAERRRAGLLVMGAYGRTRFSERVFGGTTRAMLSDVRIPLLLTH